MHFWGPFFTGANLAVFLGQTVFLHRGDWAVRTRRFQQSASCATWGLPEPFTPWRGRNYSISSHFFPLPSSFPKTSLLEVCRWLLHVDFAVVMKIGNLKSNETIICCLLNVTYRPQWVSRFSVRRCLSHTFPCLHAWLQLWRKWSTCPLAEFDQKVLPRDDFPNNHVLIFHAKSWFLYPKNLEFSWWNLPFWLKLFKRYIYIYMSQKKAKLPVSSSFFWRKPKNDLRWYHPPRLAGGIPIGRQKLPMWNKHNHWLSFGFDGIWYPSGKAPFASRSAFYEPKKITALLFMGVSQATEAKLHPPVNIFTCWSRWIVGEAPKFEGNTHKSCRVVHFQLTLPVETWWDTVRPENKSCRCSPGWDPKIMTDSQDYQNKVFWIFVVVSFSMRTYCFDEASCHMFWNC